MLLGLFVCFFHFLSSFFHLSPFLMFFHLSSFSPASPFPFLRRPSIDTGCVLSPFYPFPPSSLLVPLFSLAVLPTPSSSAVFSPFQKPTFPGFTLQAEPRGASGTCVRAVGGLFNSPPPSPGYQLRHGARSRLIGCLSWRQEGGDPCRSSSDRDSHRFA